MRSSIQPYPGLDFNLLVTPHLRIWFVQPWHVPPPPLPLSLSLGLLGWRFPSLVHYLLPLLVSLPLFISRFKLECLCRGKGKGFGLDCLLGCVASGMGFHPLLEARPRPTLLHHRVWDKRRFLGAAQLCGGKMAEVLGRSFRELVMAEDFKFIFGFKDFNYFLLFLDD